MGRVVVGGGGGVNLPKPLILGAAERKFKHRTRSPLQPGGSRAGRGVVNEIGDHSRRLVSPTSRPAGAALWMKKHQLDVKPGNEQVFFSRHLRLSGDARRGLQS